MEPCLFVQWKKPTDASRFVIDRTASEYSGTEQQDKIMKLMANVPNCEEICKNNHREDLSPSFRCSRFDHKKEQSTLYFVEGNLEEVDFAGRKMVYIFMTNESDPINIVELLKEYSDLLDVTPHSEDLEEIKKQTFKKKTFPRIHSLNLTNKKKIIIKWTIVAITILSLLYILQNLLNKPSTTNGTQEPTDSIEISKY